ncbi:MAG: hypothetical protein GC159_04400 [Phycisphaera sp.]|nr:hypothetical protein [Phycisphaera sp.]
MTPATHPKPPAPGQWPTTLLLMAIAVTLGVMSVARPVLAGDLGANPITADDLKGIPVWKPANEGTGVTPSVDLRFAVRGGRQVRVLPEVGNQANQNSCVGWAVAYACKTYNEAQDQDWEATQREHIFSPSFIYNQINGGVDHGSNTVAALQLVIDRGCATLATMPYTDYREQPPAAALQEATKFRASHFSQLTTGDAIRSAVAQGHVVVLVIRTDPIFNSGRYDVFTPAMRREADAHMDPNTQHRYHALCVVGFDDTRHAFLLMNSWGTQWRWQDTNYAGHTWVDYDLLRELRPHPYSFGQAAFILHDIPEKLHNAPDIDRAVAATGSIRYAGVVNGGHTWQWSVALNGNRRALESVRNVTWKVPLSGGQIGSYQRTSLDDAFALQGNHGGTGRVHIEATVQFYDNTTKDVGVDLTFNPPQQRSLSLVQTDRYWGRRGDQPYWEWSLKLNGSMTDLADVQQVTYHLHPTFPQPNVVVTDAPRNGFAFTTNGWGTFAVGATVLFRDGTTQRLTHQLKFNAPADDAIRLVNSSRNTGTTKFGKIWYDWTTWVEGPVGVLRDVKAVRYYLHPTFNPNQIDVVDGADYGFPLSRSGWGTFEVVADVFMNNGRVYRLKHQLEFDPNNRVGGNGNADDRLDPAPPPPAFKGGNSSPLIK